MDGRESSAESSGGNLVGELTSLIVDLFILFYLVLRATFAHYLNIAREAQKNRRVCHVNIDVTTFHINHLMGRKNDGDPDAAFTTFGIMLYIADTHRIIPVASKLAKCQTFTAHECSHWTETAMPILDLTCETVEASDYILTPTEPKVFLFGSKKKSKFKVLDRGTALSMRQMANKVTRATETSVTYIKRKSSSWIGSISDDVKMKRSV
uniref:AlNc14C54G4154 protein n=1 Tax=Albugo laibachii Nc14 TaxID=890382 RepID=F0WBW6_9STRA|nr:AlNc14C54G4154 [Albugo laibachii Nc14]|eukprot:CCA18645.1 AlNc14C54G4154 [Albugo laibachii Nc14]